MMYIPISEHVGEGDFANRTAKVEQTGFQNYHVAYFMGGQYTHSDSFPFLEMAENAAEDYCLGVLY